MAMAPTTTATANPFAARRTAYKLPPTTITDTLVSQETRRTKALEEQKRRRAQKVDSARHLDQFADLTLGMSDEEEEEEGEKKKAAAPGSVAWYAPMLAHAVDPGAIATHAVVVVPQDEILDEIVVEASTSTVTSTSAASVKKRKKRKGRNKGNRWADRCMYAELLEMSAGDAWGAADGLPADLESGWVALAPVPVGKRCLAVTQAAVGVPGSAPNTILRSRLLGKVLLPRFPSALPPHTVLDCILDARWRANGVLHVLDVLKWKGQDVAECESAFRFWWRDTRLAELAQTSPPAPVPHEGGGGEYEFPYPTTLAPVPYHTDTTLPVLLTHVVPLARASHTIPIPGAVRPFSVGAEGMEVDAAKADGGGGGMWEFGKYGSGKEAEAEVVPDGILLYVKEASYEAGTSPLSSWIPIRGYEGGVGEVEGPLDVFERLVQRRLMRAQGAVGVPGVDVDMDM